MMPRRAAGLAATALVACAAACSAPSAAQIPPVVAATLPAHPMSYLGVYAPGVPASAAPVAKFVAETSAHVTIASYYTGWWAPFQAAFAESLAARGITTLVQLDPGAVSLADAAAGKYDSWLRSYADSVKEFGRPVVISFGHEMNGDWYSWGDGHTSPSVFIAAWRHVVDVFRAQGADNVTWLWTANVTGGGIANPAAWWPGSAYVTWAGLDGYYWYKWQDFSDVFGPTLKDIRSFTSDPILIAETGVDVSSWQASKIPDLFSGAAKAGVLGFLWFDDNKASAHGVPHTWELTGPGSLAAFRAAVKEG